MARVVRGRLCAFAVKEWTIYGGPYGVLSLSSTCVVRVLLQVECASLPMC